LAIIVDTNAELLISKSLSMPIIMSDLVCHKDNILFSSHKIILHCPLCVYLSQFLEKEPLTIVP
ncbi:MAG: hypothetical protein ACFN23_08200, partial [Capnocytophaga gingivalis]